MGFFDFLKPIEHDAGKAASGGFNFLKGAATGLINSGKNAVDVLHAGEAGVQGLVPTLYNYAKGDNAATIRSANKTENAINYNLNASRGTLTPTEAADTSGTGIIKPIVRGVGTYAPLALGPEFAELAPEASTGLKFLSAAAGGGGINAASTALQELGTNGKLDAKEIAKSAALGAGLGVAGEGFHVGTEALKNPTPLNEIGSIGKNINEATDVKIPIGDQGFLRITRDELTNLANAKDAAQVKSIIGDALPKDITDRVAPAIALTNNPDSIAQIFDRATPQPSPPPVNPAPPISDVTGVTPPKIPAGKGSALDDILYKQTVANGGVTIDLKTGVQPSDGYAFSPDKTTETSVPQEEFSPKTISEFSKANEKALAQPGNHLGIWEDGGRVYLDVSEVGAKSADTLAKAQGAEQLGAFDLSNPENGNIPLGTIDNGVYNKLDEASNIHDSYQRENPRPSGTGSVQGVSEVSGSQAKTSQAPSLSPEVQKAVDLATQPTKIRSVEFNPEGKIKQLGTDTRAAYGDELRSQLQGGSTLNTTLKKLAPEEQDAINWFREAKGNIATLQDWLSRPNLEAYRPDIERAMNLSPEAHQVSDALDQVYKKAGANAQDTGTLKKVIGDYSNARLYQQPDAQPNTVGSLLKQTTGSAKQRVYDNLPEAIDNGHFPATTNAADLATIHLADLARANTTRGLFDGMEKAGLGQYVKSSEDIPQGWEKIPGQDFAASKDLVKQLRPITEPDFIKRVDGWRSIAAYQGLVKTIDLSYSLFHAVTVVSQAANQTKFGLDVIKHGSAIMHGVDTPEFAALENNAIKEGGLITTKISENQDIMRNLIGSDKGFYGKLSNALGARQVLAGAEKTSSLIFDHLQRYLKVTDWQNKITTWVEKHPDATPAEYTKAAQGFGKEVNAAYGGINWQTMGITKTAQSALRATLLAPDWVVSNLALWKYGVSKGVEGNAARAHLFTAFSTGLAATELANKATTGHFTNQNPKGHKWEVQIAPNVYVSLFRGGIGDLLRLGSNIQDKGIAQGTAQFAQGKLSPIARTVVGLGSGTQFSGQPITNKNDNFAQKTLGEAKFLATSALPVPFGITATGKYINDAIKSKESVNPLVVASLAGGLARFTKSNNGLSTREQASISNLAKQGASREEQNANVQFYLTLKKTATDRSKADKAITDALSKGNVGAAQQAAAEYNKKLASSFKGWVGSYGTYSNPALEKAYHTNKINLTTDSIQARIKSIKNNPLYSASLGG